jgi:hypothetical protein
MQFQFVPAPNGYYQIKNLNSGLDLVVQFASTAVGSPIIQNEFGQSGNDQWAPVENSDGTYTFYNLLSGQVLDLPNSNTAIGTQFDQWTANGQSNQKFNLIPILAPATLGTGKYQIQSVVNNLEVNVSGGSTPKAVRWPTARRSSSGLMTGRQIHNGRLCLLIVATSKSRM